MLDDHLMWVRVEAVTVDGNLNIYLFWDHEGECLFLRAVEMFLIGIPFCNADRFV